MTVSSETKALMEECTRQGISLTRDHVLEWAEQHPASAIWQDFDSRGLWDDATAAKVARLAHAGQIIMRCKIVYTEGAETKKMRGLIHLDDEVTPGYVPTENCLTGDSRWRVIETIVRRVLGELSNYDLEEFAPIRGACMEVLEASRPRTRTVRRPEQPVGDQPTA